MGQVEEDFKEKRSALFRTKFLTNSKKFISNRLSARKEHVHYFTMLCASTFIIISFPEFSNQNKLSRIE